jgi:hypothetical protein
MSILVTGAGAGQERCAIAGDKRENSRNIILRFIMVVVRGASTLFALVALYKYILVSFVFVGRVKRVGLNSFFKGNSEVLGLLETQNVRTVVSVNKIGFERARTQMPCRIMM